MEKNVLIISTLDTKGLETEYLVDKLKDLGLETLLMDISMRGDAPSSANIPPERVAAAGGSSFEEIRNSRNRSQITNITMAGASNIAADLLSEDKLDGVIAIGGSNLQLLQPLTAESPVGRFLAKRGEGLHHVAFAVPDIEAALEHLASTGARLVDQEPRIGGGGHRIAFVHPSAFGGTLVELVEGAT